MDDTAAPEPRERSKELRCGAEAIYFASLTGQPDTIAAE